MPASDRHQAVRSRRSPSEILLPNSFLPKHLSFKTCARRASIRATRLLGPSKLKDRTSPSSSRIYFSHALHLRSPAKLPPGPAASNTDPHRQPSGPTLSAPAPLPCSCQPGFHPTPACVPTTLALSLQRRSYGKWKGIAIPYQSTNKPMFIKHFLFHPSSVS